MYQIVDFLSKSNDIVNLNLVNIDILNFIIKMISYKSMRRFF